MKKILLISTILLNVAMFSRNEVKAQNVLVGEFITQTGDTVQSLFVSNVPDYKANFAEIVTTNKVPVYFSYYLTFDAFIKQYEPVKMAYNIDGNVYNVKFETEYYEDKDTINFYSTEFLKSKFDSVIPLY